MNKILKLGHTAVDSSTREGADMSMSRSVSHLPRDARLRTKVAHTAR